MRTRIGIIAAGLVLALVALTGCASQSTPTSWVRITKDGAALLTWTNNNGAISGYAKATVVKTVPTRSPAITTKYSFVGAQKGSTLQILFTGALKGTDYTGKLSSNKLTITESEGPDEQFVPGTITDYEAAAAKLKAAAPAK